MNPSNAASFHLRDRCHQYWHFCAAPHFLSKLTQRFQFCSVFTIRFDLPFLIQLSFSYSNQIIFLNSIQLLLHIFYFCFESQHPNPSWVIPQGVTHRPETGSIPRFPLRYYSLVCIKNHVFIVGIGPIFNNELEFIFLSDWSDCTCVYSWVSV